MEPATAARAARLRADVEALAQPAGRMVGTAGHDAARRHLEARLRAVGLEPYVGASFEAGWTSGSMRFANLLGVLPGSDPCAAPLVLAAHYDTCGPLPGADDNAAAVAIVLEAVAPLRARRLPRPLLCALFDAEEFPWSFGSDMGSVRFYHAQRRGPVHGAIVMDLVGHAVPVPGLEDVLFATGAESDADWEAIVRQSAAAAGMRLVPVPNRCVGDLSDHHAFRLDRRPYLFLSCGRWEHYHSATDTPDKLDYAKTAAVCTFVIEAADRAARAPLAGPFEGWDSTPFELAMMRASFGPLLAQLGLALRTRSDIESVVVTLMRRFGL